MKRPSLTARHVAWQRASLERLAGQYGDPDAERRLDASLHSWLRLPGRVGVPMASRTRFFDETTRAAIDGEIRQVVVLGAGYDGRALRFAHPGVRFFEVDHPATQADKRRRLQEVGADVAGLSFVGADLSTDDLGVALSRAGFERTRPALFLCEGLLPYLSGEQGERLLGSVHSLAAPGSLLACNFHVRPPTRDPRARLVRVAGDALLWAIGEPRRSEFRPGDPQALLTHTGWTPEPWIEADDEEFDGRLLLVRASP